MAWVNLMGSWGWCISILKMLRFCHENTVISTCSLFVIIVKSSDPWGYVWCTAYCIAGIFGGLVVPPHNRQIKIRQNFFGMYVRMAIAYHTAKLKSANIFVMSVWDQTTKFNFWLYGNQFSTKRIDVGSSLDIHFITPCVRVK